VGARLHPAVVADDGRSVDGGGRIDLGPLPEPDALAEPEAVNFKIHLGVQEVLVGLDIGVEGAHVLPVAAGHVAHHRHPVVEQAGKHVGGEVHRLSGFDVVEHLGFQHVNPGVDGVGKDLAPAGLLQKPLHGAVLTGDDNAELEGVLHGLEADRHQGLALPVEFHDASQVDIGKDISGNDEEWFGQLVHGIADRSCSAERVLLGGIDHPHPELRPVAKVGANGVGLECHRDDDVIETVFLEELHGVLHHGPVPDRHHGLGLIGGQGAQAGPLSARHDDGFHVPALMSGPPPAGGDPQTPQRAPSEYT
jgi:hypothetical protein